MNRRNFLKSIGVGLSGVIALFGRGIAAPTKPATPRIPVNSPETESFYVIDWGAKKYLIHPADTQIRRICNIDASKVANAVFDEEVLLKLFERMKIQQQELELAKFLDAQNLRISENAYINFDGKLPWGGSLK